MVLFASDSCCIPRPWKFSSWVADFSFFPNQFFGGVYKLANWGVVSRKNVVHLYYCSARHLFVENDTRYGSGVRVFFFARGFLELGSLRPPPRAKTDLEREKKKLLLRPDEKSHGLGSTTRILQQQFRLTLGRFWVMLRCEPRHSEIVSKKVRKSATSIVARVKRRIDERTTAEIRC